MTDSTSTHAPSIASDAKRHPSSNGEYMFYFSLIFLAALPICAIHWIFSALKDGRLPRKGPVRRAWSEAQTITPQIFWA